MAAIADDSGLEVDALNGAPGVVSARFAELHGAGSGDQANIKLLLTRLGKHTHRTARFHCVIVYLRHADDPTPIISHGVWHGEIATRPRGANGFGYDPIFYVREHACTAAEMDSTDKQLLSHRGQALHQFKQQLAAD